MSARSNGFDTDGVIRDSYERVRRHDQLIRHQRVLTDLREAVEERVADQGKRFAVEQKDVERLERGGFARLIADLAGGRETKLAQERVEAEAAWQKLEGEKARLDRVVADLTALRAELAALGDARERYDFAIRRKARELSDSGDPRGDQLAELHEQYMSTDMDLREYDEARQAGVVAGGLLMGMSEHLGHALGHGRIDIQGDLVPIAPFQDYYKHQHLGAADEIAWDGQQMLDAFGRELADVGVSASVQLPEVSTRWFADVFVDNVVTDWARYRRIKRTHEEVDEIIRWVVGMVRWLEDRCTEFTATRDRLVEERDALLAGS